MRRLKFAHIVTTIAVALTLAAAPINTAAASRWESPKTERADAVVVARDGDVQIKVAKGVIIVSSPKPVQIKVFTILGQLISQETLPAGTSQLNVATHGVFIVKTGDITCKVAL